MIVKTVEELKQLSVEILLAAGADERNAKRVAEALVTADLRGVRTHGVWHLPGYVESIRAGELKPTAWPEIRQESETAALIGGNWTFGHVGAKVAMDIAIEKAELRGIALAGLVEAHHIGRLGEYAEMAVEKGMIALVYSGGYGVERPVAVPHGGRKSVLSTNPLAMGFPAGDGVPVIIDYATTVSAGSKVAQARARGEELAPGILVDPDGNPSTDPEDFFNGGGLLPFGGHKGYGQMLAAEMLGRIFTGADRFVEKPMGGIIMANTGTTMVVFRANLFQASAAYQERADALQEQIHAVPPAPGFSEVLVPGDLEERAQRQQQLDGISIADETWDQLTELMAELGLG